MKHSFHTLPMVTYSNYLTDNMVVKSLADLEVTIRLVGNDIYFNDAKVVSPNVVYVSHPSDCGPEMTDRLLLMQDKQRPHSHPGQGHEPQRNGTSGRVNSLFHIHRNGRHCDLQLQAEWRNGPV